MFIPTVGSSLQELNRSLKIGPKKCNLYRGVPHEQERRRCEGAAMATPGLPWSFRAWKYPLVSYMPGAGFGPALLGGGGEGGWVPTPMIRSYLVQAVI